MQARAAQRSPSIDQEEEGVGEMRFLLWFPWEGVSEVGSAGQRSASWSIFRGLWDTVE